MLSLVWKNEVSPYTGDYYIRSDCIRLSDLGLLPGTSFYLSDVKVTKQKGFGTFDIAGYWRRKYRGKEEYVVIVVFELDYMVNLG